MKKTFKYSLFIFILMVTFISKVSAGSISISGNRSVTIGGRVTITISSNDVVGKFSVTSSNNNILSGGTSSVWIEDTAVPYEFVARNSGTATISVVPIDAADSNGDYKQVSTITITVNPKKIVVLSTNNNLSGLSIEGATISPEFNQDILEYITELPAGTNKINVTATKGDNSASVAGDGEKEVSEGDNNLEIVVTAENGTTKTYVIKATVKEYNPIKVKIGKEEYTVVRNKKNLTPPTNYVEKTVKINNEEIPAYYNEITKYTLVALKNSKGVQEWYIKDNNDYTLYKEYKFGNTILYPMSLDKIIEGYSKSEITYNDDKIIAYKINDHSKYALIYGMNVETGEKNIYMYDSKEDTVQIYNDELISVLQNKNSIYLKILIGVTTGLILSIGLTLFIIKKKNISK